MDLYASDLRLSDVGVDRYEPDILIREYPLGIFNEDDEDSGIYNTYSLGSPCSFDDATLGVLRECPPLQRLSGENEAYRDMETESDEEIFDVLHQRLRETSGVTSSISRTSSRTAAVRAAATLRRDPLLLSAAFRKSPKQEHSYSLADSLSSTSSNDSYQHGSNPPDTNLVTISVKLEEDAEELVVNTADDKTDLLFESLVDHQDPVGVSMLMETMPINTINQSRALGCVMSLDDVKPGAYYGRDYANEEAGLVKVKVEEQEQVVNNPTTPERIVRGCNRNVTRAIINGRSITLHLPLTPPRSSSYCSSDTESSTSSPARSPSRSPAPPLPASLSVQQLSLGHTGDSWTTTMLGGSYGTFTGENDSFQNEMEIGVGLDGTIYLTEEEKRTMLSEGYTLPSKLPLTKQDERNLKKIRRKIKNKISAQESRRKKKEYLETLEKRMESVSQENHHLKRKVDILEVNNRSLTSQLQRLQSLVSKLGSGVSHSSTATCVMVN